MFTTLTDNIDKKLLLFLLISNGSPHPLTEAFHWAFRVKSLYILFLVKSTLTDYIKIYLILITWIKISAFYIFVLNEFFMSKTSNYVYEDLFVCRLFSEKILR